MAEMDQGAPGSNPQAPFDGKNAIIFGGGQNIGRAIAFEFARRGAAIAVADINADGAKETAQAIVDRGGKAVGVRVDVMDSASLAAASAEAEAALGEMDIVMNNAGLLHNGNPEDFPLAEWQRMFDCNLFGIVRAMEVFLPRMIARGHGHIVNTASFAGLYPFAANRLPYAASKAAILNLSENLAIYLQPKGVKVSCLVPGPVMTTSIGSMKSFSGEMPMRGPGSHLWLKSQDEAAGALADGMNEGRILVLTHPEGFDSYKEMAAAPDDFIRARAAAFDVGDLGKPQIDKAKFGLA
ncbi:SDR family oxidoreductase [Sphingobium sufflavum]|uniref:SDR family NAD(P)-dependent oxidoreductase n=1 Tax=Sphingobium sufflavum TaxID=1129547 RepID=UPI001F41CB6C|nr:SDR family oxidoreductase [Sphingobium sufflavum]MCE7798403.1 SDR family oxidoreductase [Sphingobium sufflavum]